MRFLVMGAGFQGSACAYDLLQNPDVERVIVADARTDALPPFLEPYRRDPRLELRQIDARDVAGVRVAMAEAGACLNALPYYFNYDITRLAIDVGVHYCDLGGNTEIVFKQLELDAAAKDAGLSLIPDSGLAPGMVNILAADGIRELDTTDTVRIRVGGLPQHPTPPLDYQIVYSIEGVLDYYTTPSWVLREGQPHQVEALSEIEAVTFPEPVGELEAFHTAGGLSTMAWTHRGRVRTMEYKTLRYPGHAHIMRAVRGLGLLDVEPVTVDGKQVEPRSVFIACAEPRLRRPGARDLVALRVEIEGCRDNAPGRITFELIDFYDEVHGISAMERTTGFSLSVTGQMQISGRLPTGVRTPDQAVPADAYIDELGARGVHIRRTVESPAAHS